MEYTEMIERMKGGRLYYCSDERLQAEQMQRMDKVFAFNQLPPSHLEEKAALLREMFAEIGENCYLETPFFSNWGGKHVHFGNGVYANFNLTLVDDGDIYVGDRVMMGPNVVLATAGHPVEPELRRNVAQFNLPIHIGANVWLGAGCIVLPGVTIGENSVIGAGSVVTKDIPANVVAVGNPCRVLRPIGPRDREYYYRDRPIDLELE
ncbi:galactoside O-acetyltransferase [Anaerofilum sp. An201]|nr:sugar O-acetyltransferase [Anaerofilum sp. An201]OUP04378.1 galactoside O-acetyltransferase [Anaerofilum sp. An201]